MQSSSIHVRNKWMVKNRLDAFEEKQIAFIGKNKFVKQNSSNGDI